MKSFLEEYGFAILAAIVVILLIAIATPVGSLIKTQVLGVVDSFASKTEAKFASTGNDFVERDADIEVVIKQLDDAGGFSITATSSSTNDNLIAGYRVKDQNGNWSNWEELGKLRLGSKDHTAEFTAKIENGNQIQARVLDEGRGDNVYYESDAIIYTGAGSEGGEFLNVAMPTKGQIITIEGKQYRVLSTSGAKAKVFAMTDATSMKFNDSSITTSFGGTSGQKYEGSKLDNYLENSWYAGLSQDMKDAIVPQDITQNMFKWQGTPAVLSSWYKDGFAEADTSGTNYTLSKTGSISIGSRHVFALDVQDVIDYLGSSFQPQDLNEMFWQQRSTISKWIWLRSAIAVYADNAFYVNGNYGNVNYSNCTSTYAVRPAFIINLSMIGFE